MTGKNDFRGAVTVEKNALGTFAQVSLGATLRGRKYFVFISDRVFVFPYVHGSRYDLAGAELSPAHVAIVGTSGDEITVELYGTDGIGRLWQSNLCDMVRGKIRDFEKTAVVEKTDNKASNEASEEVKKLNLFVPPFRYDDSAIAKVNYYSNIYSVRKKAQIPPMENEPSDEPLAEEKTEPKIFFSEGAGEKQCVSGLAATDDDAVTAPKTDPELSRRLFYERETEKLGFYERTRKSLDRLLADNPKDETLEKLLPGSKFARIRIENADRYYCVGIIGKPDFICYAVPSKYTPEPPRELDGYCQWLPVDENDPSGQGYWLLYQDAVTGESLSKNGFTVI